MLLMQSFLYLLTMISGMKFVCTFTVLLAVSGNVSAWSVDSRSTPSRSDIGASSGQGKLNTAAALNWHNNKDGTLSRRSLYSTVAVLLGTTVTMTTLDAIVFPSAAGAAAERETINDLLYRILRVREATQQEMRLIRSGKFKDLQRANVKLAIKFMLDNYRLTDAFTRASAYLEGGSNRRVEANQVGLSAVQNLYTILEYFDSSDVENLKVGSSNMSGKEELVLKGLDATRRSIDDFLAYFPKSQIDPVVAFIEEENRLNIQEFDPSLGSLLNMPALTSSLSTP